MLLCLDKIQTNKVGKMALSFENTAIIDSLFNYDGIPGPLIAILTNEGFENFSDQGDKVSFVHNLNPPRKNNNLFFKLEFVKSRKLIFLTLGYWQGATRYDAHTFLVSKAPLRNQVIRYLDELFKTHRGDKLSYIPIVKSSTKDWNNLNKAIAIASKTLGFD